MYEKIGGKIKGLAVSIFIINAVLAVASGIYIMVSNKSNDSGILVGVLVVVIGFVIAWASSLITYGFGELIDTAKKIEANTRKKEHKQMHRNDFTENELEGRQIGEYTCPQCGMSNDFIGPCERCGYNP